MAPEELRYLFNRLQDSIARHELGVQQEAAQLQSEGFQILGTEVPATTAGLDFSRRFDLLVLNSDDGLIFGVEVKTSILGIFQLNAQQTAFDIATVQHGAWADGHDVTGVMYRGVCFGCGPSAAWSTLRLLGGLKAAGIPFSTTTSPLPGQ